MIRRFAFLATCLAVSAACLLPAPGASAQCRLCATPTTESALARPDGEISLQVEAALDFDRLVLLGTGEGTAQLRPDGSSQVSGVIGAISNRAMVGSATVRGEPGRAVRIDLPRQIELYSLSGGRVSLDEIVSDLPGLPKLDATGLLVFRFGGRIRISGDAEGDYRGDMPIAAEYL
jgi:hypothetical protein